MFWFLFSIVTLSILTKNYIYIIMVTFRHLGRFLCNVKGRINSPKYESKHHITLSLLTKNYVSLPKPPTDVYIIDF